MDINDSNNKSQTGGLKLMTVFIAVLALHVVVIGGFTVYHLMSGGSSDTDLATSDKTHKGPNGASVADGALPDATQADKTTVTPPTDVATIPSTTVTPAPTAPAPIAGASATATPDASTVATTSTPAPAPITTPAPAPTVTPEPTSATTATTTASTMPASTLAPPPEPTLSTVTPAPDAALTSATSTSTEAPAPTPATEVSTPAPQAQAPTGPIPPQLAPPSDASPVSAPAPAPAAQPAPASSFASGPVHMPPANVSAQVPRSEHERMTIYIVKITDSYKKIAHRHHITVAQLKEVNHITGNVLHTGQKLYIPSEKTELAERAPTSTLDAAPIVNGSAAPMTTGLTSTSTTISTTGLHHHLYTVVKGDTLTRIAHRYKTTAAAIMAENGITDPTKLSIGRKLRIPTSGEIRSARNTTPASTPPSQVQAKTGATTAQLANYGN